MTNPSPSEHFFVAYDKTPIHYFLHPSAHPVGSILLVHGAGEHGGRYADIAQYLARNGFHAAALDLRGYGKSGGPRAYVKSFAQYSRDIDALLAKLRKDTGGLPAFLFGHSMGGLIVSRAAASDLKTPLAGLVLSSPCFDLAFKIPEALRVFGKITACVMPQYKHHTLVISETLTHDPERVESHRKDPLICNFITSGLFNQLDREMLQAATIAKKITTPVLVVQAGDDRVVSLDASRKFHENLPVADKKFVMYPGYFHEVINETHRKTVYDDILSWLKKHL